MVVLRVSDKNPGAGPIHPNTWTNISLQEGHFNDCMVEVEIQDKQPPVIVAPPDMVVSCWFWFDPSEAALEDPNNATFGRIVTDLTSRRKVVSKDIVCHRYCEKNIHDYPGGTPGLPINSREAYDVACDFYYAHFDTAHWDRKYELVWGQDGYALSTCAAPEIDARNNIHCGQGSITRTFGFGTAWRNITASQTIYIVDCDPFWISGVCFDILDDITWGPNECSVVPTIPGCGPRDWSPDNPLLGRPKVVNGADDNCALIAIEYEDERFTVEPDACLKIIRTWTVIDWCQYDPTDLCWNGLGRWEYTEIIKVADTDAPVVSCGAPDCSGQGLATIDARTGLCVNHITLTASAFDSCSPVDWLKWEYKIDIWNDGKGIHGGYDYRVGSLTQKERAAGDTALVNHNDYADDRFNPFDASGTYPLGIHKIKWFVEDGCGNVGVCETLFEVKDCKKPTPYCLTGIITVPMPSTGCIDIWAVDLNLGSFDNCTPKDKLKFYFNGDKTATSRTICCEDFVAGAGDELILDVEMWVEDEEGNTDFCKTQIIIQDVNDVCPNGGSFGKITGAIKTIKNDEAKSVNMELLKNGQMMKQGTGSPYAFLNLAKDVEYTVKPNRNDDHLNGVTTADIVKIQKHILGQEAITSPYLLIAADVNATNTITAADMSEIRKLILGVTSEFKSVKSWTFVPNSYVFADPTTPWSAPRTANVMLNAASKTADFYAIKMGDINENARAGVAGAATTRSAGTLNFEINDKAVQAGETYKVSFKSSDFNNISGYQFTMKFDASALTFEGVEAGSLKTTEGNFGLSRVSNGIITTSWNSNKGESYGADEVLFTVVFKANKSINIGSAIAINSEVTTAEAYDVSLNAKNVKLSARTNTGVVETAVFELFQNEPNPFNKQTVVSFNLPTAAAATLTMYDVTGKVLRIYEIEGVKGVNTKVINKSDLNGNGVIYYQLDAANFTATKRMVVID
ncbi:MAG: T9SS type A sorting domain-containing protein [Saprospiraceae bacterium]|nr:T9SS type A sorting domain-containing protein [Saprospiraceae bacterium]